MMKKTLFGLTILLLPFAFIACSDDDDDRTVEFKSIPTAAQSFLNEHIMNFDETLILRVEQDKAGTYEVKFKNGIEIDFYSNGVWKEIDLNNNTLPNTIAMLLPEAALNYISSNYPTAVIEEIEKKGLHSDNQDFKIELRDDREILFDYLGNVKNDNGQTSGGNQTINKIEDLPETAQTFLNKYFEEQTPDKIELEWNKYEITYNNDKANEVEVEFFKDGSFKSIEVEGINEVTRSIISEISASNSILDYLDKNHAGQRIEEFSMASSIAGTQVSGGYVIELDGNIDYKIYFDAKGGHVKTIADKD